jgi:hypothetical protein
MVGGINYMEEQNNRQAAEEMLLRMARKMLKKSNDAVKLAYLEGDHLAEQIDGLDLSLLSELKRNANGTVEIKLVDRVKALAQLAALLQSGPESSASSEVERFYQALEEGAQVMGHD